MGPEDPQINSNLQSLAVDAAKNPGSMSWRDSFGNTLNWDAKERTAWVSAWVVTPNQSIIQAAQPEGNLWHDLNNAHAPEASIPSNFVYGIFNPISRALQQLTHSITGQQIVRNLDGTKAWDTDAQVGAGGNEGPLDLGLAGLSIALPELSNVEAEAAARLSPKPGGPQYLFRGTSEGYRGNASLQRLELTPTSTSPAVATVFATNSTTYGEGILTAVETKVVENLIATNSNVLSALEQEVVVSMSPENFMKLTEKNITAEQARGILKEMGINIPSSINNSQIDAVLKDLPAMSQKQIDYFYKQFLKH